jgi:spore coat protein U-like protein
MRVILTATVPGVVTPYYGRVAAGQTTAIPAAYSTTMTATITGQTYTTAAAPACPTASIGTRTFTVTGTVISACNATATNLTFPSTSFFTANIDGTSAVNVTCTNTTPYHVRLSGGNDAATDPTQRKMTLGTNKITYGLYRDLARTLPWGSTDTVNTLSSTGTASSVNHTVYGRVPPQTSKPPGTYTDTIVVTVSFL